MSIRAGLYLVASIVLNTLGIEMYLQLVQRRELSEASGIAISLVVCVVLIPLITEIFYRAVEVLSASFAHNLFAWIRE